MENNLSSVLTPKSSNKEESIMSIAAIDAGTTGVRCMIAGNRGEVLSIARRHWDYITPQHLEIAKEFDTERFWGLTCDVIKEAIRKSGISVSDIEGVATTSQRHGIVLLDADGKELYGGPNIDARGAMTQFVIEDSIGEKYHEITGCWPPMMFAPTKVAWFEEEEPDIHEKIAHLLPISDWITHKLSGECVTEPSSASATGFYDINKWEWSPIVISAVDMDRNILPDVVRAGEIVGEVNRKAEVACGLPQGLQVIQGGTDTHCALLACEVKMNEITAIAGSTTPVMTIMNKIVCAPEQRMWTSCHILPGQWTMESNATLTGAYIEWVIGLLCEKSDDSEKCREKILDNLSEILKDVPPGSNETMTALGPNVMDCQKITDIPLARMYFPQPALPQVKSLDAASMIQSVIENIAYAVRGNYEQLSDFFEFSSIKTVGGTTKSRVWVEILANVLGREVYYPIQPEGSLLGAAICAATGMRWYDSINESAQNMVQWHPKVVPDERSEDYQAYYNRWKETWIGCV